MIGNVWEWTSSPYQGAHDQHMGNYSALRQQEMSSTQYVIKGALLHKPSIKSLFSNIISK